jgi:hypothetical protein
MIKYMTAKTKGKFDVPQGMIEMFQRRVNPDYGHYHANKKHNAAGMFLVDELVYRSGKFFNGCFLPHRS